MPEKLLSVKQFADGVGRGVRTVYWWIDQGHITAVKAGLGPRAQWRIPESEVARVLAAYAPDTAKTGTE